MEGYGDDEMTSDGCRDEERDRVKGRKPKNKKNK